MEGTLRIIDGRVLYVDDILDENFDGEVDILDAYMLGEMLNKPTHPVNPE